MTVQALVTTVSLGDYVDRIVAQIEEAYPQARCPMRGETYGDEDVGIDVYVPEEQVLEVSRFAHEVALDATLGTEWLILPSVASLEFCPVKS